MVDDDRPKIIDHLHWLGHDSFRIDQPIVIYLDPWRLPPNSPQADLILISHEHGDHCSSEDVELIRRNTTTVVTNAAAAAKLPPPISVLQSGERIEVMGVAVDAVPAYNVDKPFHPKSAGGLGFVLRVGEDRIYFAGDTDLIPEMEGLACDVALLPVSGKYVMTAVEAVKAAEVINPRIAIPMHYGAGVAGTLDDAERFRELSATPVLILEKEGG